MSVDYHAPSANTDAVVTYAAPGLGYAHRIDAVSWSATGTIAAAVEMTVKDGSTTLHEWTVNSVGIGQVAWPSQLQITTNAALEFKLPALGVSGTGRVNVHGHSVVIADASMSNGNLNFVQTPQSGLIPTVL